MEHSESTGSTSPKRSSALVIVGLVVVAALIITGLFLPPISLGSRLGLGGSARNTAAPEADRTEAVGEGEEAAVPQVVAPEGVQLALTSDADVTVSATSPAEFAATAGEAALPPGSAAVGSVYVLAHGGEAPSGQITLPLPAEVASTETLDLYGWNGNAWTFVPSRIDPNSQSVVTFETALPEAVVLVDTAAPETRSVAAEIAAGQTLADGLLSAVSEVTVGRLTLNSNGGLDGEVAELPEGVYQQYLHITNSGAIVDQTSLMNLLATPAAQDAQIDDLLNRARNGGFDGVNLDYQGAPVEMGDAYTAFVTRLAEALDAEGLNLALTLDTPTAVGSGWNTGGQDWAKLGALADVVYVQMPLDPTAYGDGGTAQQLIDWATDQIDRRKLNILLPGGAVSKVGEAYTALDTEQALANFGELQFTAGGEEVEPGAQVDVALTGTASPLEWDGSSLMYRYEYEQNGQSNTVWLGNEAALTNRLQLSNRYNLRGVTVQGLGDIANADGYAAALGSYLGTAEAPQPTGAAILWTVRDENDTILASNSGSELTYSWTADETPGVYRVQADFALGNNVSSLGALDVMVAEMAARPIDDGDPGSTLAGADDEDEDDEEEPAAETASAVTPTPSAPVTGNFNQGEATAVVAQGANVRTGPGLSYGTVSGGANPGTRLTLIGRNSDSSWLNITLPDGTEGWIFAQLVTVNPTFDVSSLDVVEVAAAAAGPGQQPAAPAPPPPAAVGNVGTFELGGQAAGLPAGTMQYAGMTWIKRQHKWSPGDPPEAVAGLISEGHAAGFKVLLSMPGQLNPSSIDYNAYVNFLGGVAALPDPPDAIEVWNEMNISREWPAGQIDPAAYVNNMLRPGYQAIKAANPNIMVIAGAPAPTGFFSGCGGGGCDDAPYVAGMMAAGAGSVSDCVGVHYNEGIMPPSATSGDPRGNGGHYTRYFQGMINAYTAAGASRLCFTELGYLSGEEWGYVPAGFLWKGQYNLTVAEHAQYLAEAVRVAVQSGRVRLMIVFNVDFTTWGDDPQAGYAMIRPGGGCPACETLRAVLGR